MASDYFDLWEGLVDGEDAEGVEKPHESQWKSDEEYYDYVDSMELQEGESVWLERPDGQLQHWNKEWLDLRKSLREHKDEILARIEESRKKKAKIAELLKSIRNYIDPTTGERFPPDFFEDPDIHSAIIDLAYISQADSDIKDTKKNPSKNELNRPSDKIYKDLKTWYRNLNHMSHWPEDCVLCDEALMSIAEGDVVFQQDLLRVEGVSYSAYDYLGYDIYDILKPYLESDILETYEDF